jgi:hypothetical protein
VLLVVGTLLAAAALTGDLLGHRYHSDDLWPITRQFDFSEEGNFANWYESVTLLAAALLLATIGIVTRKSQGRYHRHWLGLSFIFLFVSIDEAAQIHETTVAPILAHFRHSSSRQARAGATGAHSASVKPVPADAAMAEPAEAGGVREKASWMPLYLVVLAAVTALYLRFYFSLAPRVRVALAVAAFLYVGGAVGVELIYERLAEQLGDQALICQVITTGSEWMEMAGVAVFIYGLMTHLHLQGHEVEFRFEGPSPNR